MTRQRIRRGIFRSIADLQAAINAYLAEHNTNAKPFVWTRSADAILAKLDRLPVLGLTARFVQNRTLSGKQSKISGCRLRIGSARTANPGHFPSKILFQKRCQRQAS
jgi:hypothetical protein